VQLAKVRPNVLVVSTDPAHNLSDAFGQKFGREPVKVNGFENLFCMEVDSSGEQEWEAIEAAQSAQGVAPDGLESGVGSIMKDLMTSVPGIDEAMAFAELMKMVQEMNYSTIVFDTAPTGHTLRLLSFPKTMESAIGKLLELKVSRIRIICVINHWPGLLFAEPLCWFINSSNSIYGTRRCRRC
jgi:arsenite-transporting ATPase